MPRCDRPKGSSHPIYPEESRMPRMFLRNTLRIRIPTLARCSTMSKSPLWFSSLSVLALLWNLAGLFAVVADLRLSAADIASLTAAEQAMYEARPLWSVVASLVAVVGGTLGCVGLLLRKRVSLILFYLSLVGVWVQDAYIFLIAGVANSGNLLPLVIQGLVLVIAIGLVVLARKFHGTPLYDRVGLNLSVCACFATDLER